MKTRRPKPRGIFQTRIVDGVLEVWMGTPEDPESELAFRLDPSLIPAAIAALRAAEETS